MGLSCAGEPRAGDEPTPHSSLWITTSRLRLGLPQRADAVRLLRVEMQGVAALEDDPLVHEVDLHLSFVDEDELLAQVFLERRVAEVARWVDDERQQRAGADLLRQGGIGRAVVAAGKRLALVAADDAVAVEAVVFLAEQALPPGRSALSPASARRRWTACSGRARPWTGSSWSGRSSRPGSPASPRVFFSAISSAWTLRTAFSRWQ